VKKFKRLYGDSQGFVDQKGVYMTRKEAFMVAEEACQIANLNAVSES